MDEAVASVATLRFDPGQVHRMAYKGTRQYKRQVESSTRDAQRLAPASRSGPLVSMTAVYAMRWA